MSSYLRLTPLTILGDVVLILATGQAVIAERPRLGVTGPRASKIR